MNTFARVQRIIADTLNLNAETVTRDVRLVADLNAGSMDLIEINMALEDQLGVGFSAEAAGNITVGEIVDTIDRNQRGDSQ